MERDRGRGSCIIRRSGVVLNLPTFILLFTAARQTTFLQKTTSAAAFAAQLIMMAQITEIIKTSLTKIGSKRVGRRVLRQHAAPLGRVPKLQAF